MVRDKLALVSWSLFSQMLLVYKYSSIINGNFMPYFLKFSSFTTISLHIKENDEGKKSLIREMKCSLTQGSIRLFRKPR